MLVFSFHNRVARLMCCELRAMQSCVPSGNVQRLAPTTLGVALVTGYQSMGLELSKPHLRRETEVDIDKISQGSMTKEQVRVLL